MAEEVLINIHAVLPYSRVNGPGKRMVIFFQGCSRGCAGCFNPDTHPFEVRKLCTVEEIFSKLRKTTEGVTVSGGEPFMQPEGLIALLRKARGLGLTTVVYTGFKLEGLEEKTACRGCLPFIDVLVDGSYEEENKEPSLLARGSTNQRFQFLTGRYDMTDFYMPGKVEVVIQSDGAVIETGFSRITLRAENP